MKKLVFLLVMLVCALPGNAQLLRSSTIVESSAFATTPDFVNPNYLDHTNIDQTIYWRRRYNGDSQEKTVYNFHSLFKRDSVIGVRVYGIDIDMMTDVFEKPGANEFRYWNKLRMGFTLMLQKNPKLPDYPSDQFYNYINGEIYLSYLHLPRHARGDRMTKSRRGSFMMFFLITPTFRMDVHCKINLGGVWMKGYYHQEYGNIWVQEYWNSINRPRVGLCAEWEMNPRGYDKTKVHSSKDLYRGFTCIVGPEYNLHTKEISLRVGMKWDLRNHGSTHSGFRMCFSFSQRYGFRSCKNYIYSNILSSFSLDEKNRKEKNRCEKTYRIEDREKIKNKFPAQSVS